MLDRSFGCTNAPLWRVRKRTLHSNHKSCLETDSFLCQIQINAHVVAEASGHYEQMKDFVGAEIFVDGIKYGKL